MTEENQPTPLEGGSEGNSSGTADDLEFDDEQETVDVKAIQEAIGRDDIKSKDDVIKWAKNVTKYVGENEFSSKAKEVDEFKKATGMTPAEYIKKNPPKSQTPTPQGNETDKKVDWLEAITEEPNIKYVKEEVLSIAKAEGKPALEVFKNNGNLQKLATDLADEERSKNSITPPSSQVRVQGKSVDDLSNDEIENNYQEVKDGILKKHGVA